MRRVDVARTVDQVLAEQAGDHVVMASLGSAGRAWREVGSTLPTFYASDPMGAAPGITLGAAIARPDLNFVLLEGDGDLTMNLGSLLTIGGSGVRNLSMVVFANHRYETGGGQPLAGHDVLDIAACASSLGWSSATTVAADSTCDDLAEALRHMLATEGPAVVVVRVHTEASPYGGPGDLSGAEAQFEFRRQIAARDAGTTDLVKEG